MDGPKGNNFGQKTFRDCNPILTGTRKVHQIITIYPAKVQSFLSDELHFFTTAEKYFGATFCMLLKNKPLPHPSATLE